MFRRWPRRLGFSWLLAALALLLLEHRSRRYTTPGARKPAPFSLDGLARFTALRRLGYFTPEGFALRAAWSLVQRFFRPSGGAAGSF
jgi:hypothetical protein